MSFGHLGIILTFCQYDILPFSHSDILTLCHYDIMTSWHSVILLFCHSVILIFCYSEIMKFWHSDILTIWHSHIQSVSEIHRHRSMSCFAAENPAESFLLVYTTGRFYCIFFCDCIKYFDCKPQVISWQVFICDCIPQKNSTEFLCYCRYTIQYFMPSLQL